MAYSRHYSTRLFISKFASAGWTVNIMGKTEILHEIRAAEEKVQAMGVAAEERRKQLQSEGKRRALELIEATDTTIRKETDAQVATARTQIEQRKKALLEEGHRKAEALVANARDNSAEVRGFALTEFESAADA